jgi:hypothetical protein
MEIKMPTQRHPTLSPSDKFHITLTATCPHCQKLWTFTLDELERMTLYNNFAICTCQQTRLHWRHDGDLAFDKINSITNKTILEAIKK